MKSRRTRRVWRITPAHGALMAFDRSAGTVLHAATNQEDRWPKPLDLKMIWSRLNAVLAL